MWTGQLILVVKAYLGEVDGNQDCLALTSSPECWLPTAYN